DDRISLNDGVESNGEWDTHEYHDTADSGKKKEAIEFTFYQMETEDISEKYDASCFVNGLEAYDGEINLGHDKNLISNEYAVKLHLEHEVKNGDKVFKNELIVALRGDISLVTFIINPEEDDIKQRVVLGRSFLRLTKGIADFKNKIITIYPDLDLFNDVDSVKANDSEDNWDVILEGIDFGDIPEIDGLKLPPYGLLNIMGCVEEIKEMLEIKVYEIGGKQEIFTSKAYRRLLGLYQADEVNDEGFEVYFQGGLRSNENFNARDYWLSISSEEELHLSRSLGLNIRRPILRVLQKMITYGVCQRTTGKGVESQRDSMIFCGQFITRIAKRMGLLTDEVLNSLSALVYCRALDAITFRELIGPDERLIAEDPSPKVLRVAMPRVQGVYAPPGYDEEQ
nr:hypothetical protein [Tanacetum cinerariifolium]